MNKDALQDQVEGTGQADPAIDLVEIVLGEHPPLAEHARPERIEGVVIGVLTGLSDAGEPLVEHPAAAPGARLQGRALVALGQAEVGREVALMFEGGDPQRPIVMGLIHVPAARTAAAAQISGPAAESEGTREGATPGVTPALEVIRDGERVEITAREQLVLRCGKASITLTRAGKILIHGTYLLSRSSGVHRIQGGSVQIN